MTREEKARAYDEALKRADSLTEKYGGRDFAEYVFPELAESEDERIRKAIIGIIKNSNIIDINVSEKQMLAYLEKQKELDKMIVVSPEVWDKAISDAYENGKKDGEKQKEQKVDIDKLRRDLYQSGYNDGYQHGKEDAQKEPHYTKRNALFDKCVENCDPAVMKKVSDEVDEMLEKEQKPEWSEEDEDMLNSCISSIEEAKENRYYYRETDGDTSYDHEISWLKSLRPQPKKNDMITPNKEFFQWIYNRLVDVHNENPNVDYMISFKKRIEEMSFDKSHWRPSEEQMGAVKHAYNSFPNDCSTKSNLKLLYHDLEKLM